MGSDRPPVPSVDERLAALFRMAGYEVQQAASPVHGAIGWLATPGTGRVRSKTYLRALSGPPSSVEATLVELDAARGATQARQAFAVVMEGRLPEEYAPDLAKRSSHVLTLRRWLLEISGIAEGVRSLADLAMGSEAFTAYLPRRGRLDGGEEVLVEPFIEAWAAGSDRPMLIVEGPERSGKSTVINAAIIRAAVRFVESPEGVAPLYLAVEGRPIHRAALELGLFAPVALPGMPPPATAQGWRCLVEATNTPGVPPPEVKCVHLALLPR
jgi:hypothetical protein